MTTYVQRLAKQCCSGAAPDYTTLVIIEARSGVGADMQMHLPNLGRSTNHGCRHESTVPFPMQTLYVLAYNNGDCVIAGNPSCVIDMSTAAGPFWPPQKFCPGGSDPENEAVEWDISGFQPRRLK